jgi:hypothetical protein
MTIQIAWISDTSTLQPAIEHAVARFNAHFLIVSEPAAVPNTSIDLAIWTPSRLDQADYEQIRPKCLHMVICVPKGVEIPRWYPRYDPRWPSCFVVVPFDTDEFALILELTLRGPALAAFEPEQDNPSMP